MNGKIFFISGPSGVGKGTLIDFLRKKYSDAWVFPPSCTTRDPRPGEKEGETYFFISLEEFEKRIAAGDFLEYAQVHNGHFYGTLRHKLVDPAEKEGKVVIREFDVQGFDQARKKLPRDLYVSIFLKPFESIDYLMERIRKRAPISDEETKKRAESMNREMQMSHIYDHILISREGEQLRLVDDFEALVLQYQ